MKGVYGFAYIPCFIFNFILKKSNSQPKLAILFRTNKLNRKK